MRNHALLVAAFALGALSLGGGARLRSAQVAAAAPGREWPAHGGDAVLAAAFDPQKVNGRQYVVIAAGSGKMGTNSGDAYVAFSLPQ